MEQLRSKANLSLQKALMSGRLDELLADLKKPKSQFPVELLRQQSKGAFVEATTSGLLGVALCEVQQAKEKDNLCQKAKKTLQEALISGALDTELDKLTRPTADESGTLRWQGMTSGALDAAMAKEKKTREVVDGKETMRLQAKDTLLEAAISGDLDAAMEKVKMMRKGTNNSHALRQRAKKALEEALASGALDAALAPSQKREESAFDIYSLRQKAKKACEDAEASGVMDTGLNDLKKTGNKEEIYSLLDSCSKDLDEGLGELGEDPTVTSEAVVDLSPPEAVNGLLESCMEDMETLIDAAGDPGTSEEFSGHSARNSRTVGQVVSERMQKGIGFVKEKSENILKMPAQMHKNSTSRDAGAESEEAQFAENQAQLQMQAVSEKVKKGIGFMKQQSESVLQMPGQMQKYASEKGVSAQVVSEKVQKGIGFVKQQGETVFKAPSHMQKYATEGAATAREKAQAFSAKVSQSTQKGLDKATRIWASRESMHKHGGA